AGGNSSNEILYVYSTPQFRMALQKNGFTYELYSSSTSSSGSYESGKTFSGESDEDENLEEQLLANRVTVNFLNARQNISIEGINPRSYYFNYFTSAASVSHVPVFEKVVYNEVYPNIDLVFYFSSKEEDMGKLHYDWIVRPG